MKYLSQLKIFVPQIEPDNIATRTSTRLHRNAFRFFVNVILYTQQRLPFGFGHCKQHKNQTHHRHESEKHKNDIGPQSIHHTLIRHDNCESGNASIHLNHTSSIRLDLDREYLRSDGEGDSGQTYGVADDVKGHGDERYPTQHSRDTFLQ